MLPDWLTAELAGDLTKGVIVTVAITLITTITSLGVGLAAAIGRRRPNGWPRRISTMVVEIFRNVPALILIIFFAFAVPNLFPADLRRTLFFANPLVDLASTITTLPVPYYALAAIVALTLNTGAHLAEILRAGMSAVPQSRIDAARSLGASPRVINRSIVIPDGVRVAFPAITNRLIHNLKNTALVSFVAVPDAFSKIQATITKTFEATELLVFAAVLYLALATVFEAMLRRVEVRLRRGHPRV